VLWGGGGEEVRVGTGRGGGRSGGGGSCFGRPDWFSGNGGGGPWSADVDLHFCDGIGRGCFPRGGGITDNNLRRLILQSGGIKVLHLHHHHGIPLDTLSLFILKLQRVKPN